MRTNTVIETSDFSEWLRALRDHTARAKIFIRVKRLAAGNMGDVKHFDGISEMRIDHGPGYRVYFAKAGSAIYLLLSGGDKSTQARDIAKARRLLADRLLSTHDKSKE